MIIWSHNIYSNREFHFASNQFFISILTEISSEFARLLRSLKKNKQLSSEMASFEETLTNNSDTNAGTVLELAWSQSILYGQSIAYSDPRALARIVEQFSITTHKANLFRLTIKVKNAILVYDMIFEALKENFEDAGNWSRSVTDKFADEIQGVVKRYERSQWLSDQDSSLYLCWLDSNEENERFARSLEGKSEDMIRDYTRNAINDLGVVLQKTRELNAWSGLLAYVEHIGWVPPEPYEPQQSDTESASPATEDESHEQIRMS